MIQYPPLDLPDLNPVPDDIETRLADLLARTPDHPALEDWLLDLIKASGHLSTLENLRWRVFCMVWLAGQFDIEKAWPYLMWFNMNEEVIADHVAEMLVEGANELNGHVHLAVWSARTKDDRFARFMSEFYNVPAPDKMPALLSKLYTAPHSFEAEAWLSDYCKSTAENHNSYIRPWRLVAAAWYATLFNPAHGLYYLQRLEGGNDLAPEDNKRLREYAQKFNGLAGLIEWRRDCDDPAVKAMLEKFPHPDLGAQVDDILSQPPNYAHLQERVNQAAEHAQTFRKIQFLLESNGIDLAEKTTLNLGCGPLASHALLLSSAGYKVTGADLDIPPRYLPTSLWQKFKLRKYVAAWEEATAPYYEALAQASVQNLDWKRVKIDLADLTRLKLRENSVDLIWSAHHLHHQPDVVGLLSEAARVLKPDGLFVGEIRPYPSLRGAFRPVTPDTAWEHLIRPDRVTGEDGPDLNRWPEAKYKAAFEERFSIETWLIEQDNEAETLLTDEIRDVLPGYTDEELTRSRIYVLAVLR